MKMKIVLLFLLIVCMTATAFTACVKNDQPTDTAVKETDLSTVTAAETDEPAETYYIPESKYKDEDFCILCPGKGDNEWQCSDFFAEDTSEDPVVDAVYRRQDLIESTFGIKITTVESATRGTIQSLVKNDVRSGDRTYDIVMQVMSNCYTMAQSDLLINLENVPYLDLTSESWDQSYLKQSSIGNQNFFATGEITTMDNDATWVMMFNKSLASKYDISNIYDIVKAGDWTFDKLYELTNSLYKDVNNNGEADEEDEFGIATTIDFIQGLFYAANGKIVQKNDEDLPYLDFLNQKNTSIIDNIIKIYYKANKITFDCHDFASVNPSVHLLAQAMFEQNRALFYSEVMQCAIRLRDMETDYGIIPCPKYDKAQTNYTTHSVAAVTLCCCFEKSLLSDQEQLDRAGMVAQALAVEGKNILTPAYYEKSLLGKGTRDAESQEMLPIIFANRTCDIGYMAEESNISTMYSAMRTMVKAGNNEISSVNDKNKKKVNKAITDLIDAYESLGKE